MKEFEQVNAQILLHVLVNKPVPMIMPLPMNEPGLAIAIRMDTSADTPTLDVYTVSEPGMERQTAVNVGETMQIIADYFLSHEFLLQVAETPIEEGDPRS